MEDKPKRKRTPAMIAAQKRYYQRHREECLERQRKWYAAHPDYRAKYNAGYTKIGITPEERKARNKEKNQKSYVRHLEYRKRKALEYYYAHREERLAYQKEYNKRKKEEAC